jgi:hypothetical protein
MRSSLLCFPFGRAGTAAIDVDRPFIVVSIVSPARIIS